MKEGSAKQDVEVDRAEVSKTLTDYMEQANKRHAFPNDDRPLDLKHLKLVALLQDDKSKEILQAVQLELPIGTVTSRLARARAALAEQVFGPQEVTPP